MKRAVAALLLLAIGCGAPEPVPEETARGPAPVTGEMTKEERVAEVRRTIELKRNELRQKDIDLGKITEERFELEPKPASEAKTSRMAELARMESDIKAQKRAIEAEIADLERRAQEISGAPRPRSADEALDLALEAENARQREEAEKRRLKAEAEAAAERRRLEEAERERLARESAREKERVQAAPAALPAAAGGEGLTFEERWADVIMKVRAELQRYKRW